MNVYCLTDSAGTEKDDSPPRRQKQKTKKYFCIFCRTLVDHFSRHLLNKHKEEEEVLKLLTTPVGSTERKKVLSEIRGKGAVLFNSTYELNKGHLIVARRNKGEINEKKVKPCIKCHNYYSKSSLWRHYRNCSGEKNAPRDLQARSSAMKFTSSEQLCDEMKTNILPGMEKDSIYEYLLKDEVILEYGNYLCNRHKLDRHLTNMIRSKLRQLSKLTLAMIKASPDIHNLDKALSPQYYDIFIKAVNTVTGFDGKKFKSPSLVGELGRAMKLVANRRIIHYIKFNDEDRKSDIEKWLHIYNYDYYHNVGKSALMTIQKSKYGKVQLVPLTQDIIKVNNYINEQINHAEGILKRKFDIEAFTTLNNCLLSQIQIFNRKRAGEIEMFEIKEFENRHNISKDSEFYKSLKPSEKAVANKYMRIETRGKLHLKPASILLTRRQIELIKLIIKHRKNASVDDTNSYVFAKKKSFFKACTALREIAYASDAEHPDLITGTWLRKHIATTAQALNFSENDMTNLAAFLGHDIKTHRQFYRLPNEAIHLAKLSRLLMAMDNGSINEFHGKSLDEINVDLQLGNELDLEEDTTSKLVNEIQSTENVSTTGLPSTPKSKCKGTNVKDFKKTLKQEKTSKLTWTTPERHVTRNIFKDYIYSNKTTLPTPMECREAIRKHKELQGRTINQVKGWVFSEKKRIKKNDM